MGRARMIDVDAPTRLLMADGSVLSCSPSIMHRAEYPSCIAFCEPAAYIGEPTVHTFDVVLTDEDVARICRGGENDLLAHEEARAMLLPLVNEHTRERFERAQEPEFLLATLEVEEFRAAFRWELGWSWSAWLDAIDGETAEVGEIADWLIDEADGTGSFRLIDGSLYYLRRLGVHHAARGQQLGARLIAHALWTLHRSDGDVAVLLVRPTQSIFDETDPPCDADSTLRLARYYGRMGFKRYRPHERPEDGAIVPMYACHGERRLNFKGAPSIGHVQRR